MPLKLLTAVLNVLSALSFSGHSVVFILLWDRDEINIRSNLLPGADEFRNLRFVTVEVN